MIGNMKFFMLIIDQTSVIMETSDLSHVSPAFVACCALVCCQPDHNYWKALFESWGDTARQKYVISSLRLVVILLLSTSIFCRSNMIFIANVLFTLLVHCLLFQLAGSSVTIEQCLRKYS